MSVSRTEVEEGGALKPAKSKVSAPSRILATATQGAGGDDEARLRQLLEELSVDWFAFDRKSKRDSFFALLSRIRRTRPELVVMEGTGIAGGLALMLGRLLAGVPYVVSSGDAVGPFVASLRPMLGPLFGWYERALCRHAAGFIGWTPYLAGRALTYGTPRVMTAAGWAPFWLTAEQAIEARRRVRSELGIPDEAIVIGIVGSLAWNRRVGYCYGHELVRAVPRSGRQDVRGLVVGDGQGRARLEELAGASLGRSLILPGRVPRERVPEYLAAMDLASLPQSVDGVGSFRYTTKLSEYVAAGLPIVTGQIPLAYDLDGGWLWRLPGPSPWSERYVDALASLLAGLNAEDIARRRQAVPTNLAEFDRARQIARVTAFLNDLMEEAARTRG